MSLQRTLPGLVLGLLVAAGASAQAGGALRWRGNASPVLYPATLDLRASCDAGSISCEGDTASAPLWISAKAPRAVLMEVAWLDQYSVLRARQQGMNLSVVGKASLPFDLGVYGRVGTFLHRSGPGLSPTALHDGAGLSYGLGMSWDFSRRGSASLAWDSYDLRTPGSDWRASLGLQWRY